MKFFVTITFFICAFIGKAQLFSDGCLNTVAIAENEGFLSTEFVYNVHSSDVLEWNGTEWVGGFDSKQVSILPAEDIPGCRAVFLGSGILWTTYGESIGIKLTEPMIQGQTYTFLLNYVSHGKYSNGDFVPKVYSNSVPELEDALLIDSLPSAGFEWVQNSVSFVCDANHAGNEWIVLHNGLTGSTGLISSFCPSCLTCSTPLDLGENFDLCIQGDSILEVPYNDAVSYEWQDGSTESSYQISQSGTYWVELETTSCATSDELEVYPIDVPDPYLGEDGFICDGELLELNTGYPNDLNLWQDLSTNNQYEVTSPGTYWVDVFNPCGHGVDTVSFKCETVDMPNIFTPNSDGFNDTFIPELSEGVYGFSFSVYDRWGNEKFTSNQTTPAWDGKASGEPCAPGVYYWVAIYTNQLGLRKSVTGNVTVIR